MCLCECAYVCVYMCMYVCECVHVCECVYMCVYVCVCLYVCVRVCMYMCVRVCAYIYVCVSVCICVCVCVCMSEYVCERVRVFVCVWYWSITRTDSRGTCPIPLPPVPTSMQYNTRCISIRQYNETINKQKTTPKLLQVYTRWHASRQRLIVGTLNTKPEVLTIRTSNKKERKKKKKEEETFDQTGKEYIHWLYQWRHNTVAVLLQ